MAITILTIVWTHFRKMRGKGSIIAKWSRYKDFIVFIKIQLVYWGILLLNCGIWLKKDIDMSKQDKTCVIILQPYRVLKVGK